MANTNETGLSGAQSRSGTSFMCGDSFTLGIRNIGQRQGRQIRRLRHYIWCVIF